MDTGNYMANQMDSLIENGLHQMDEFINDLDNRIEKFIKENGYTWTVEEIVKEYREKYTQGFYVSFTCKKVIENFKEDLAKSTGISFERRWIQDLNATRSVNIVLIKNSIFISFCLISE